MLEEGERISRFLDLSLAAILSKKKVDTRVNKGRKSHVPMLLGGFCYKQFHFLFPFYFRGKLCVKGKLVKMNVAAVFLP